ncbi:hypothetical protein [uncultured Fibrobacter sp.]|uniref:tetratricopeptide repeat protein n=1 Tax=uncultured Fibrobacter sp. TaxID=261512 RepID=UPI0025E0D613|nr:hypothetical protein [uncultured Fibrobacter sp.]
MSTPSAFARKAAYLFLVMCVGAAIAFVGYYFFNVYGPSKVTVEGVPFGLPAGTSLMLGDTPDFQKGVSSLPVQTQAELRRATELSRSGSLKAAYDIYEAIVMLFPDCIPAVWGEANTLFEMDTLTDAQQSRMNMLVAKIQGRFPGSGVAAYMDSRKAYAVGNTNASLELARIACDKAPALYEARLWYAKLLAEHSRVNEAFAEAHAAVSLSFGKSSEAFELLASMYHSQGILDSCASLVDYALSQYPVNVRLLLLKGYLEEYKGHFDSAEKIYQRILAIRPDFNPARMAVATIGEKQSPVGGMGTQLTPRDRAKVACEILEPLVERYPENLPLREALGLAYLNGRDFDLARNQFQEIMARDPEYPDIAQRIQETKVKKPVVVETNNAGLASDLNRAVDSLRQSMEPATTHDFSTMLGHYLVRYGATPREFFKRYSISNFRPVADNVWQESFYVAPYMHRYTVVFDSKKQFREVHVVVYDSSSASNHLGVAPEVYTRLLKQNSRISGIGNSTGETDCGDGVVMDAAVWETQDNFEILARFIGKPAEVRMVRFDKSALPPGIKLCDYVKYLNQY